MTTETKPEKQAELERARYLLEVIIAARVDGKGIYNRLKHRIYAAALMKAVDDYLESLAALEEA